jgi:hypothetical protein
MCFVKHEGRIWVGEGAVTQHGEQHVAASSGKSDEQAANAVAGLRDLRSEIVIEAAQHGEFGERLVGQSKRAQRMRHRAGGLGNDRGIAGVGLGFTGMQIGNAAHGQTRQIGDQDAFVAATATGSAPMVAG